MLGGGQSGGGWHDEGMKQGRQEEEGWKEREPGVENKRNSEVLRYKGLSYVSQDGTPGTVAVRVSPTHRHGNADRIGQPDWHHHGIPSLEI